MPDPTLRERERERERLIKTNIGIEAAAKVSPLRPFFFFFGWIFWLPLKNLLTFKKQPHSFPFLNRNHAVMPLNGGKGEAAAAWTTTSE